MLSHSTLKYVLATETMLTEETTFEGILLYRSKTTEVPEELFNKALQLRKVIAHMSAYGRHWSTVHSTVGDQMCEACPRP